MTDIVFLLRYMAANELPLSKWRNDVLEAADEIERLRSVADAEMKLREGNFAEIERLRGLLCEWLEFAKDVQPGCAAGADWLESLRKRTALPAPGEGRE